MKAAEKVIVALDTTSLNTVRSLLKELDGVISFYKIGFELFTAQGWKAVDLVRERSSRIFLDLKLHDIPNTVAKTAAVICEHEIDIFNVHCSGGFEMMRRARETVDSWGMKKPLILGVTVLTSLALPDLVQIGVNASPEEEVLALAALAKKAGLDGVVSSPQEISPLRKKFARDFVILTPGIRPSQNLSDDQKRTLTPKEAVESGADFIVVGRPITDAKDRLAAAKAIVHSLSSIDD